MQVVSSAPSSVTRSQGFQFTPAVLAVLVLLVVVVFFVATNISSCAQGKAETDRPYRAEELNSATWEPTPLDWNGVHSPSGELITFNIIADAAEHTAKKASSQKNSTKTQEDTKQNEESPNDEGSSNTSSTSKDTTTNEVTKIDLVESTDNENQGLSGPTQVTVSNAAGDTKDVVLIEGSAAYVPALSREQKTALQSHIDAIEDKNCRVGFTLINLKTGKGIAYNLDENIYGASSFKGPYAVYVCEEATGGDPSSDAQTLLDGAIVWSDNNYYYRLRSAYDDAGLDEWLNKLGVKSQKAHVTFPTYSVRDSARMWTHCYNYLNSDASMAEWLNSEFALTEKSFLRDGVRSAGGASTIIRNKAGWCSDAGSNNSVVDAGIVVEGDSAYLISIMTSLPDSDSAEAQVAQIAATLYSLRGITHDEWDTSGIVPFDGVIAAEQK